MVVYTCERCGYDTKDKSNLTKHLRRASCKPVISNKETSEQLEAMKSQTKKSDNPYNCRYCKSNFNSKSSMYRHMYVCKEKKDDKSNSDVNNSAIIAMQENIDMLKEQIQHMSAMGDRAKLQLELQYYKNRKNEGFYQQLLESHFGATHKKLACGITDITTLDMHGEIKEWKCWKEALGQLIAYQTEDQKERLCVFLFGKYPESCKNTATKVFQANNIKVYDCIDSNGTITVTGSGELLLEYHP
jgi:hypothetical protein